MGKGHTCERKIILVVPCDDKDVGLEIECTVKCYVRAIPDPIYQSIIAMHRPTNTLRTSSLQGVPSTYVSK
jgi:hypothetical protein